MATRQRQPDRRGQRQQQITIQIPENVSEFYANSFNVGTTAYDFILFFGSVTLPQAVVVGGPPTIRGQIRVDAVIRMSPQHAKASLRALATTIGQWEARYGEIKIPVVEASDEDIQEDR